MKTLILELGDDYFLVVFIFNFFYFRGSISSSNKVSRNNSFRFDAGGVNPCAVNPSQPMSIKKEKTSVFRNLVNNLRKTDKIDESEDTSSNTGSPGSVVERMTSKSSRKSGMSVSQMDTDTVKFKLVEDLSLVR